MGNPRPDALVKQHEHRSGDREHDGQPQRLPRPRMTGQCCRDGYHCEGQQWNQKPRPGRPASSPFRVAEIHQEYGRDDAQRHNRQLNVSAHEKKEPSGHREEQDGSVEEKPSMFAPEQGDDFARVGRGQAKRVLAVVDPGELAVA